MEIQKIFSDYNDEERIYSVLMSEDELRLFAKAKDLDNKYDNNFVSDILNGEDTPGLSISGWTGRLAGKRRAKKRLREGATEYEALSEGRKHGGKVGAVAGALTHGSLGALGGALATRALGGSAGKAAAIGGGVGAGLGALTGYIKGRRHASKKLKNTIINQHLGKED